MGNVAPKTSPDHHVPPPPVGLLERFSNARCDCGENLKICHVVFGERIGHRQRGSRLLRFEPARYHQIDQHAAAGNLQQL